jgi:PPOX class probable F420-dependent enzyme
MSCKIVLTGVISISSRGALDIEEMKHMDKITSEVRAFLLETARTGKLATVRADGRPHVVPIWFDLDENNIIYFNTGESTVKGKNMRRDPRIALCVDDERPPYTFSVLEGTVTFVDDDAAKLHWATSIAGRYMGEDKAEAYGKRNAVEGELLVRFTVTKVLFQKDIAD